MKFENKPINFQPKPLFEDKEFQQRIFEKKERMFSQFRPKEINFTDLYPIEEIEMDLAEVARLEHIWDQEEKDKKREYIEQISSAYEAVISEQISSNDWFGPDCTSTPASKYDDVKNGIDVVTIFDSEKGREYLGLGVDVTFSLKESVLQDKLDSIRMRIKELNLPFVKYFEDPETGEHKSIFIPKVVVGSRLSSAEKLVRLWAGESKDKNHQLAQHPVSSKLIMESLSQLMYFYKYASSLAESTKSEIERKKYEEIALGYAKVYNKFYDIYEQKKEQIESHLNEISDDIVYETILKYTNPQQNKEY